MATENRLNVSNFSVPAGSDLSAKQFYAMTINSSGQLAQATDAKNCDGWLQDKPNGAGVIGALQLFGVTKASAGAAVSVGDLLELVGGQVVTRSTGVIVGKALTAAGAQGDIISVLIYKSNSLFS